MTTTTWRDKAHRIIGEMCFAEWDKTNTRPDGRRYKKHRQYHVPEMAKALVDCLAHDDEERAKSLFLALAGGAHHDAAL